MGELLRNRSTYGCARPACQYTLLVDQFVNRLPPSRAVFNDRITPQDDGLGAVIVNVFAAIGQRFGAALLSLLSAYGGYVVWVNEDRLQVSRCID